MITRTLSNLNSAPRSAKVTLQTLYYKVLEVGRMDLVSLCAASIFFTDGAETGQCQF